MRFFNLLKKELRDIINAQMIGGLIMTLFMFYIMGNVMTSSVAKISENEYSLTISDCDDTEFTQEMLKKLEESGAKIEKYKTSSDNYADIIKETGKESILIIPEGFTEKIMNGEKPEIISVAEMKSAAMMSNLTNDSSSGSSYIKNYIKDYIIEKAGIPENEQEIIKDAVEVKENTVVSEKTAAISAGTIIEKIGMQNMLLPIIVFLIVTMTSQTIVTAISTEKIDKTLETLLSTPVSRTSIIFSKMAAAAIAALLNAVMFMFGIVGFMGGAIGNASSINTENLGNMLPSESAEMANGMVSGLLSSGAAMKQLGLNLSVGEYCLIGIQLFFTILICLSISIILGSLVNDTKSSQTIILPIMLMSLVPYMITLFADVNTLPAAIRTIVYLIPFTHTFTSMNNLMFGHTGIFFIGMAYQAVFFCICMFFALKLFKSDKILTVSLNFSKKKKVKTED